MSKASYWVPEFSEVKLKLLGKLAEEAGELTSAAARCIIQGIDESQPVTGKVNQRWLEEEIADVLTMIYFVKKNFNLDNDFITERITDKSNYFEGYFI